MTALRCIGVNNTKNRCKVKVRQDSLRVENCLKPEKNMCFMHCDCEYCSSYYSAVVNRGLIYKKKPSIYDDYSSLIESENDIVKLKCILQVVNKEVSLDSFITKAQILYESKKKNKKIMAKIESLENEIEKLKEEIK